MVPNSLLRKYILEIIEEMRNANVAQQLLPRAKKQSGHKKDANDEKNKEDSSNEIDETNVVANIVGYTAPLGASSADVGLKPTKPGQKLKKKKKNFVRWK